MEVVDRFLGCGFDTAGPTSLARAPLPTGSWLNAAPETADASSLFVRDQGELDRWDGRALAVIVFAGRSQAEAAYKRGIASVPAWTRVTGDGLTSTAQAPQAFTEDRGPPLLPGYGLTVWRRNLALTQLLALPPNRLLLEIAGDLKQQGVRMDDATDEQFQKARADVLARLIPRAHDDLQSSSMAVDRDFAACLDVA